MNNCVKLEFYSLPKNVALARLVVASVAGQNDFTLNDIEELKVAVSEAVSNSIIHGYNNQPDGLIKLSVEQTDKRLLVIISDHGKGIENIQEAMQPAFSSEPDRMGLGFVFMQSFMDDLCVESTPGQGTTVSLTKNLPDTAVKLNTSQN